MRAEKMKRVGPVQVLQQSDLHPPRLAKHAKDALFFKHRSSVTIDLDGAKNTAKWITGLQKG
ncbi:hypothetical protein ACFLZM_07305 [Thermodesulfobacteriota bacterium]